MAVKRIHSVARALSVLEVIAERQPLGVSELARCLDDDISALQRIIVTLADAGWIRAAAGKPTRWELTMHIQTLAYKGRRGRDDLRAQARSVMDALRAETGESVLLALVDNGQVVCIDVLESVRLVRTVPRIGGILPLRESAAAQALLAGMSPDDQTSILGESPDPALLESLAATQERGYAVNDRAIDAGVIAVASAIFDIEGRPVAAISVSGPAERLPAATQAQIGRLVSDAARSLSLGQSVLAA